MTAPRRRTTRRRILIALLLLLLLMAGCSILEGSAASLISITFRLNDDAQTIVGTAPVSGGPMQPSGSGAAQTPSGRVPQGTSVFVGASESVMPMVGPTRPGAPAASVQESTVPPPFEEPVPSAPAASSRRGGGNAGGGQGNGGGGGGGSSERNWTLSVLLRDGRGRTFIPHYHFQDGEATISVDDRRFTPGFYTLILTRTDTRTRHQESTEQPFPWGVLAMNTDADRYRPDETGHVAIGVLDASGAIICDADLTLTVVAPSGTTTLLSTEQGTIRRNDTCGQKIAGLLTPDYETDVLFAEEGTYSLRLLADRGTVLHPVSSMESRVQVTPDPRIVISRTAATRLWPVAPSTMEVRVFFRDAFSGDIEDRVPLGFVVSNLAPFGTIRDDATMEETVLRWNGSWAAGETAIFSYTYDAPDISPEFYLIGPMSFESQVSSDDLSGNWELETRNSALLEQRSWQIANDDVARSDSYDIQSDTIASGGGEQAVSSNYLLADTLGEPIIGPGTSNTYELDAGYRQEELNESSDLSLSCATQATIGSILFTGVATTTFNCVVGTTNTAGYSLSWQVQSGSGGTATGSLIDPNEHTIPPYRPSVAGTPETWSIANTESAWGGRLRSASTDTDAKWGTDTTNEKWLNVGTGSTIVVSRGSATTGGGSTEQLSMRVEVGTLKIQPSGSYQTTVTMTASAL